MDTLDPDEPEKVALTLIETVDPHHGSWTTMEELFGSTSKHSGHCIIAFIEGAQEFFAEVEDEL